MLQPIHMRLLFPALVAAFFLSVTSADAEPRLALVISNSAYSGGMDPLPNPVNDGRLIAGTLKKLGFTVMLLTDADQRKMKRAISDFGEAVVEAGPTASALFYYAGHGLQVGGQNYLVPVNADIRREADVDLETVSAEAVLTQMEYAAPRTTIVILDACRNNPLSRSFRSATRGLARMDAPNGSYVAYSTAPGETAADGAGTNSPFALALAEEMVRPGQGIEEAFRNVRVRVTKATGGVQTPWDSSSLLGSFFFAGEAAKQVAAVAPAPAPAPAPLVTDIGQNALEMSFWESIKNSNDPGDYAAYIAQYPGGSFVKLAESRLKKLESNVGNRSATEAVPAAVPAVVPAVVPEPAPIPEPAATALPDQVATPEPVEVAAAESPVATQSGGPLPDGTIVLSPAAGSALKKYLASSALNGFTGYFHVSKDGQHFGAASCINGPAGKNGIPECPTKAGSVWAELPDTAAVRKASQNACAKGGGDPCIVLYSGKEKKAGYQLSDNAGNVVELADIQAASAPAAPETAVPAETAAPAAVVGESEPDYESPLADGTIVLSRKVGAQLDAYLGAVGRQGVAGFFYVTPDGRSFGSFACGVQGSSGLPGCPMKSGGAWVDPQPDNARVKQRAHDACIAGGSSACTMLYSNKIAKAKYSVVK